jgi:hypothetical protein
MGRASCEMQGRLRIETPEHAAVVHGELVALEKRFRTTLGDRAAGRELAREIIRLRTALTSYSLRHQARNAYDQQAAPDQGTTLRAR